MKIHNKVYLLGQKIVLISLNYIYLALKVEYNEFIVKIHYTHVIIKPF
jgi:hypothetical protein